VKLINATNVQAMMDEAIGQLTDQTSVADAWNSLLPDFREDHGDVDTIPVEECKSCGNQDTQRCWSTDQNA